MIVKLSYPAISLRRFTCAAAEVIWSNWEWERWLSLDLFSKNRYVLSPRSHGRPRHLYHKLFLNNLTQSEIPCPFFHCFIVSLFHCFHCFIVPLFQNSEILFTMPLFVSDECGVRTADGRIARMMRRCSKIEILDINISLVDDLRRCLQHVPVECLSATLGNPPMSAQIFDKNAGWAII